MKIVIAGATGFIGVPLCLHLAQHGHAVIGLSRNPRGAPARLGDGITLAAWDGRTHGNWAAHVNGAGAVINLVGEGVADKRWSPARKAALRDSRVQATDAIVQAIAGAATPPSVLVNASAIGWYGPRDAEPVTESTPPGTDFLAQLCVEWEAAARAAEAHCRVVCLRIGVVLGADGGALAKMLLPFKMFVGGPLGSGRQHFPWVHRADIIGLVEHAIDTPTLAGPVNATAPEGLSFREFCRVLGRVMRRPSWASVPAPVLRLLFGEMATILLDGQHVQPAAALASGYRFQYPTAEAALTEILGG